MAARLNARANLCTVTDLRQDEGGAFVETLSCGHVQFCAPHVARKIASGQIRTSVGMDRKCWTCPQRSS